MRYDQYPAHGTFFALRCLDCSVEMAVMEGSDLTLLENSRLRRAITIPSIITFTKTGERKVAKTE